MQEAADQEQVSRHTAPRTTSHLLFLCLPKLTGEQQTPRKSVAQQYQPPVLPGVLSITEATYQTEIAAFLHPMFSITVFLVFEFAKMARPFLHV